MKKRNGVCELCGHVNTCTHEHTVEIEYWDYDNCTITDLGDMHEVSGPYQRILRVQRIKGNRNPEQQSTYQRWRI